MEYRRKCTVCGKIYCYSESDVSENSWNQFNSALSGLVAVTQIFGGTMLGAYAMTERQDKLAQRVRNFSKCPYCNSESTVPLTEDEWNSEQNLLESPIMPVQQSTEKTIEINVNASTESLLKRAHLFLEDSEWEKADAYCERILDVEPENSLAYLGKLMAEYKVKNIDELITCDQSPEISNNYQKAVRFADAGLSSELSALFSQWVYYHAEEIKRKAQNQTDYLEAAKLFQSIVDFRDANEQALDCVQKAEDAEKEERFIQAVSYQAKNTIEALKNAITVFEGLNGWRNSSQCIEACSLRIEELEKEAVEKRLAEQKREAEETALKRQRQQRNSNHHFFDGYFCCSINSCFTIHHCYSELKI